MAGLICQLFKWFCAGILTKPTGICQHQGGSRFCHQLYLSVQATELCRASPQSYPHHCIQFFNHTFSYRITSITNFLCFIFSIPWFSQLKLYVLIYVQVTQLHLIFLKFSLFRITVGVNERSLMTCIAHENNKQHLWYAEECWLCVVWGENSGKGNNEVEELMETVIKNAETRLIVSLHG